MATGSASAPTFTMGGMGFEPLDPDSPATLQAHEPGPATRERSDYLGGPGRNGNIR